MLLLAVSSSKQRIKIEIHGIVQGVGFRPFVYNLAQKYTLKGFVLNDGSGVKIEVEGLKKSLPLFLQDLEKLAPPLARIDEINHHQIELKNDTNFSIIISNKTAAITMISPDISLCDECKKEMNDTNNRRYNYPFTNCTNCGPRYTIIKELPYDRKNSSMAQFPLCDACQKEYDDPTNRRYHAQPISCYDCGVCLSVVDAMGEKKGDPLGIIVEYINAGAVVAIKGLGGFHIVCDATNDVAVMHLRKQKRRAKKPLAVMFPTMASLKKETTLTEEENVLILSKERPIVLVKKNDFSILSQYIAPNIDKIGVFLPYTPLHEMLLKKIKKPLVATSANLKDEPIICNEKELFDKLHQVVEIALTYDREIVNACDDSVVMEVCGEPIILRLSRGFAPKSFPLMKKSDKKILALGANQKNTITLAFGENIIISAHIGDLNSLEAFEYFLRTMETFKKLYAFEPDTIVCDKHPNYETTKWAKEYVKNSKNIALLEVQHHYAHALSVMAEYNLDDTVLAFCFDGTGYGDDGILWGGEVLLATPQTYERILHVKEFSLLGGERAIKEPRRVALSLLFEYFSLEEVLEIDHKIINSYTKEEIQTLYVMKKRDINSPKCTSVGRLFDAMYAFSGFFEPLSYEGESGLVFEKYAKEVGGNERYSYLIKNGVIDYKMMIQEVLLEKNPQKIAVKFINTMAKIVLDISLLYKQYPVVLSGGVFQNKLLLEKVIEHFKKHDINYYIQHQTPINDGGISFGQAYHALHVRR